MTATVAASRSAVLQPFSRFGRRRAERREQRGRRQPSNEPIPPLGPRLQFVRAVLVTLFVLAIGLLLQVTVVSSLQHSAAQGTAFDDLREQLALGTAPIGPVDEQNRNLELGTPVAFMEIRALGLKQVVLEGTTSGVLMDGPGHRRDSPLPGQVGTSIVLGRRAAYGGPFSDIQTLRPGDVITFTTGQGVFDYSVIGVRPEGSPVPPPPAAGSSRLLLVTAAGRAFMPNGVMRVDAELKGTAVGGAPRTVAAAGLPKSETIMHGDTGTLWALALWLQALIGLSVATVWSWHRWGRLQTSIVFTPALVLVGLYVAGEIVRLLPNLL